DLVDFRRRKPHRQHFVDRHHHAKSADAVGDKIWPVLRRDNAFPQPPIEKARHLASNFAARLLAGNDLDELHIPRRVEKVNTEKMLFEIFRKGLDYRFNWNSARV